MSNEIDVLFISYFANRDRWHNDDDDAPLPSLARNRGILSALADSHWMKDEEDVVIEGELYDFSRFLSWVRYDTTSEHERYDPFSMTLLSGSYYLNYLAQHGYRVHVVNAADRVKLRRVADSVEPRFVLLSTTLLFDAAEPENVSAAVREIRAAFPGAIVVLGGLMLVSYEKNLPREHFHGLLRSYGADAYVVTPRGETALLELLRRGTREAMRAPPGIPATYLVTREGIVEPTGEADAGITMEEGSIRWSALPQTDHLYHTVHMRTARSCAFSCAFCEYPINQGPLTLMPVEAFERELEELQRLGSVRSLVFTDDTFNVPLRRFKEMMKILARYDFEWYSFFRPQYADEETARLMKAANCRAVFAGLESVDDQVLKNMNKVATADAYRRGIDQLKQHDVRVHANFIVGFPGETERSARKITPFINELGIEFCTVSIWSYIPSTPISLRKDEFELEGMGVEWKHSTMDWQEAQALGSSIVGEQRGAVHNTVRGEAWTEFLLYANGFAVDEAQLAVRTFNGLLGSDCTAAEIQAQPEYQALRTVLERREMARPTDG